MSITSKEILQALSHVDDPDLNKDIVTLGMVRNINISDNRVSFDLVLTTPACPMKEMLEKACITSLRHFVSQDLDIAINVTSEVRNNNMVQGVLNGVKNIIAVASGKGGVGKSTVSVSLAKVLANSGAKVGLMDADIYGPSQPILTGTEQYRPDSVERAGKSVMKAAEADGIRIFSIGYLIKPGEPVAWRGPMLSSAIKQFVQDVDWGELDYLIVDLPPGTGDVQITLCQAVKITGAVVVTTPQKVAVEDARRALQMFKMQGLNVPVLGIISNMAWFETPELPDRKFYIFGENGANKLAEEASVPFLGAVPIVENLAPEQANGENGNILKNNPLLPFFSDIAGNLVRSLAIHTKQSQSS